MRAVTPYTTKQGIDRYRVKFRTGNTRKAPTTTLTFDTRAQGERFAKELDVLGWREALERAESRGKGQGKLTVDEYAGRHIDTLVGITAGTRVSYERIYARVWAPAIGHMLMEDVDRHDIMAAVRQLSDDGKADKTVANAYGLMATIFRAAVADGVVPASPCRGIRLPRATEHNRAEMQILDHDEFEALIEEIPDHYKPLVVTLVGTGIRWGEAEGLEVRDLVLTEDHPMLMVRRAAKWNASKARREVGPPKTKKGRREIELAPEVADVLRPLIRGRASTARVFTAPAGGELRHRTFWSDIWRPALFRAGQCAEHRVDGCACGTAHPKRCKVHDSAPPPCGCAGTLAKPIRIHDLRHTAASWMLAAGIPPHVAQVILGHESIKTTVDTYGHLMPEGRRAVATAMSAILGAGTRARALEAATGGLDQ